MTRMTRHVTLRWHLRNEMQMSIDLFIFKKKTSRDTLDLKLNVK